MPIPKKKTKKKGPHKPQPVSRKYMKAIVVREITQHELSNARDHDNAAKRVIQGEYRGERGVVVNAWLGITKDKGGTRKDVYFDLELDDGRTLVGLIWWEMLSCESYARYLSHKHVEPVERKSAKKKKGGTIA